MGMNPGQCGKCHVDMIVARETESAWTFKCPRCGLLNGVMKRLIGGTKGSGNKDDGTSGNPGRGYRGIVR